jgi:hypothetical protein
MGGASALVDVVLGSIASRTANEKSIKIHFTSAFAEYMAFLIASSAFLRLLWLLGRLGFALLLCAGHILVGDLLSGCRYLRER